MADYDDAERHAIQEVEAKDQLKWMLEEVDEDLEPSGWLQTQVAPPPGVPQLRCDCVVALHSRSGSQGPWACLIEAQGQPLAGMAIWTMIYLGLLHNVLRFQGRDPYNMMAVILNLSEALIHTIDWIVPLKKKPPADATPVAEAVPPADAMPSAEATPADIAPSAEATAPKPGPAQRPPGVSCVFFIKNVRQESAAKTLDRIDLGELGLCILVWVPLMAGADDPEVARRWCKLALRQTQLHLLADYAALALVFAEMAGRKPVWKPELEGFNVQESPIMRSWRKEGALTNARAAVVSVLQARFPESPVPEGVRSALDKTADLRQLNDWLRQAVLTGSPADFERSLAAPPSSGAN